MRCSRTGARGIGRARIVAVAVARPERQDVPENTLRERRPAQARRALRPAPAAGRRGYVDEKAFEDVARRRSRPASLGEMPEREQADARRSEVRLPGPRANNVFDKRYRHRVRKRTTSMIEARDVRAAVQEQTDNVAPSLPRGDHERRKSNAQGRGIDVSAVVEKKTRRIVVPTKNGFEERRLCVDGDIDVSPACLKQAHYIEVPLQGRNHHECRIVFGWLVGISRSRREPLLNYRSVAVQSGEKDLVWQHHPRVWICAIARLCFNSSHASRQVVWASAPPGSATDSSPGPWEGLLAG